MTIKAILIVEVLGRPASYLPEALKTHVENINKVKNTQITNLKISDAKLIEGQQDAYSCFAEVEVETESMSSLMGLVFDFMPSSVEVLEPYDIEFNSQEASMFLSDLSGRLHKYDEIAKLAKMQVQQLATKFQQMQQQPRVMVSENLPNPLPKKIEKKSKVKNKKAISSKKKK
jgi:hypothetical protein